MPLVTDYRQVKEIYAEAAEHGIALPVFCAEDRETLEAILAAAMMLGQEIGVPDLPVIPAWTCRYPPRGQMRLLTHCGDPVLSMHMMFSDLALLGSQGPYARLRILPHLDHAFPWLDGDMLEAFADRFASVMCDASEKPLDENIRLTRQYVEKVKGRVVVEGAVDEIREAGGSEAADSLTTPAQARKFLDETGVDIIVPNVGTEHRATAGKAQYHPEQARAIRSVTGNVLCLHGATSLALKDMSQLPADGFVKVNIYTALAVSGGQAVARTVLDNLGNIFPETELRDLIQRKILGENTVLPDYGGTQLPIGPKLAKVANPPRRDAWFYAVRERCRSYMDLLHYRRFTG